MFSEDGSLRRIADRIQGRPVETDLEPYRRRVEAIERLEPELAARDDTELRSLAAELRVRAGDPDPAPELCERAFALVRETARRTLGLRPFDTQLLAALALQDGRVVEMQTGEGKTLAAVMPTFVAALAGRGAHVLTFNDYLARRDAEWMGPVYRALGLRVGFVQQAMDDKTRRRAYAADVTYLTAKEAGYDFLRDGLRRRPQDLVQRPFHLALVDEADSILIDEARVPLVLAGGVPAAEDAAERMARVVAALEPGVDWVTDENRRNVELTARGLARAEARLGGVNLHLPESFAELTALHCALHAAALLHRDVDYLVQDGRIRIVDELTGRVVEDRHWPDGLQAAVEAKEGARRRADGRIYGSITLQHLLGLYPKLCGMSGTVRTSAEELHEFYGVRVTVIPTHRPCRREDEPDLVFTHREAKLQALVEELRRLHAQGRPVLVGTASVEESERLAAGLRAAGLACNVLNARNDELEARIVAEAGAPGALTISTNMAGRGTDIRLGGADERERAAVVALGGLYVIGTNRHESVRIDRQLRGRAGRQGDPGTSRLFVSLEDDLIVRFGIDGLIAPRHRPQPSDEPLDHPLVRREVARVQRIVDGQNFDIRRTLHAYSSLIESYRAELQRRRRELLRGRDGPGLLATADPSRHRELCAEVGEEALRAAEREVALHQIDEHWADYLATVADLREGIHLVRLGGEDPPGVFLRRAAELWEELIPAIEAATSNTLRKIAVRDGRIDLDALGIGGPSSTWTYMVNDDPFEHDLGMQLLGSRSFGFAAVAALWTGPLLVAWGLWRKLSRRRSERRARLRSPGPSRTDPPCE
jgi:preprotein translocase subunit SecA